MPILYCLVHNHVFSARITRRKELGFYDSPATADAVRIEATKLPGFKDLPDSFTIQPYILDENEENGPAPQIFFLLDYDREIVHRDPTGEILFYEDIEKTVGVYSTAVKAAEALVARLHEPEYADHAKCFRIMRASLNQTGWETGYFTTDE